MNVSGSRCPSTPVSELVKEFNNCQDGSVDAIGFRLYPPCPNLRVISADTLCLEETSLDAD